MRTGPHGGRLYQLVVQELGHFPISQNSAVPDPEAGTKVSLGTKTGNRQWRKALSAAYALSQYLLTDAISQQ